MKKYSDDGITAAESSLKQYADNIETVVKKYSDNGITTASTSLKQYADQVLVSAKSYADGKASSLSVTINWIGTRVESLEGNSIIRQTANTIKGVVTSSYISSTISLGDYAKKSQLPDMTKYYAKSDFEMTPSQIKQRVEGLEEKTVSIAEWEQGENANTIQTTSRIPVNSTTKFYLNKGFTIYIAFYNSSGSELSSNTTGADNYNRVSTTVPSGAATCFIQIIRTGGISPKQISSTGFRMTDTKIVTSAEISEFVTEDEVGNMISVAQISADKIINLSDSWETWTSTYKVKADDITWNFSKAVNWVAKNKTVMGLDASGNLTITGTLSQNSVINTSAKIDGMKAGTTMLDYKAQYVSIPSGSGDSTKDLSWSGGSTIILYGSHTSGNLYMRLPSQSTIRSTLGISSGNFVVELNIINLSNYEHLYVAFSSTNGVNTTYPRRMSFDNTAWTGDEANIQLANGDYMKILLVYNNSYYNGYTIIHQL